MPYILEMSGQFQDAERGLVTKRWPIADENGTAIRFRTKREAEKYEASMKSPYEGIPYWNVLAHGQISGSRARVKKWAK